MRLNSILPCSIRALALSAILTAGLINVSEAQVSRGFDRTLPANATNDEMVRQPDAWVMEVQLKKMRMVWVDIVDEATGETRQEQVWYLPWRAIRRPVSGRPVEDVAAVNALDPIPGPPQFTPEFTLVTFGGPDSQVPAQILPDEILPAAMAKIRQIERADHLNTVAVVQDVPEAVPADAEDQPWIYGAATWRGVDPDTDFFKVILGGFTNIYERRTNQTGEPELWRKVGEQLYTRPGDRYDPTIIEFNFTNQPYWAYQPDAPIEHETVGEQAARAIRRFH